MCLIRRRAENRSIWEDLWSALVGVKEYLPEFTSCVTPPFWCSINSTQQRTTIIRCPIEGVNAKEDKTSFGTHFISWWKSLTHILNKKQHQSADEKWTTAATEPLSRCSANRSVYSLALSTMNALPRHSELDHNSIINSVKRPRHHTIVPFVTRAAFKVASHAALLICCKLAVLFQGVYSCWLTIWWAIWIWPKR